MSLRASKPAAHPVVKIAADGPAATRVRRGMVLVIVLVATVIMSLAAYTFCDFMVSERQAVELSGRQIAARALVESGVEYAKAFIMQDPAMQLEAGGSFDNPEKFQAQLVGEHPEWYVRGLFTFVAPNLDEYGYVAGTRYGIQDESNRLNLNSLELVEAQTEGGARTLLMALPGMTEDIADAILDWIDADDEPREYGAEAEYYETLDPPYRPRNGLMASVEDLLLIRGVTPELLFGRDVNRNGIIDPNELSDVAADTDEEMLLGWSHYLTLYSKESNLTEEGTPRVFVNMEDMEQLHSALQEIFSEEWATFIVAYRQNGPVGGAAGDEGQPGGSNDGASPSGGNDESGGDERGNDDSGGNGQSGGERSGGGDENRGNSGGGRRSRRSGSKLDLSQQPTTKLRSALDLIDASVEVTYEGDDEPTTLESPFRGDLVSMGLYLPQLLDKITVNPTEYIPGRININQAPRRLIEGIPTISDEVVEEIMSRREYEPSDPESNRDHEMWLLTEGVVTVSEMRLLIPFVNAGGDVYRAQIVGYFDDGVGSSRAEAVLDATTPTPTLLFWRDLGHLGRGYSMETLGFDSVVE